MQGSLKQVEALQEVKAELEGKTTLLYTRLLEDLTSQVSDEGSLNEVEVLLEVKGSLEVKC
jgi:hypothetical protein